MGASYLAMKSSNDKKYDKHHEEFQSIFGVRLTVFWDGLFGLNVVAFDTWVKTPDNLCTYDHVVNVYGERAKELLSSLI